MATVFIIHGIDGSPEGNWIPWLRDELKKLGHKVIAPQFPVGENHSLQNWLDAFQPFEKEPTPDSILVGHSMAVAFILTLLETHPARAAFLVAGFLGPLGLPSFDTRNHSFTERTFDWPTILRNCPHFEIFHSDNDPYIKLAVAEKLSQHLNTPVTLVPGAGHFNQSTGFTKFELLLEKVAALN
jgi:predicted alpha/beta hydrolase family esterase